MRRGKEADEGGDEVRDPPLLALLETTGVISAGERGFMADISGE